MVLGVTSKTMTACLISLYYRTSHGPSRLANIELERLNTILSTQLPSHLTLSFLYFLQRHDLETLSLSPDQPD